MQTATFGNPSFAVTIGTQVPTERLFFNRYRLSFIIAARSASSAIFIRADSYSRKGSDIDDASNLAQAVTEGPGKLGGTYTRNRRFS